MIVINLQGGLGNQMFQYALGRYLALLNNTSLILNTSLIQNDLNNRKLGLNQFKTTYKLNNPYLLKLKQIIVPLKEITEITPFVYDEKILDLRGNFILTGYWQSEKYFKKIETIIQDEFSLNEKLPAELQNIYINICKSNSVAIHVRRSDYVSNSTTNSIHGTCSSEYYYNAIAYIVKNVDNPHFFISSDDPQWGKENIKIIGYPVQYMNSEDVKKDGLSLYLMSCCKHHIIANSTFSWWWAWLCENPQKIVIAPDPWLVSKNYETSDLLLDGWIKIPR